MDADRGFSGFCSSSADRIRPFGESYMGICKHDIAWLQLFACAGGNVAERTEGNPRKDAGHGLRAYLLGAEFRALGIQAHSGQTLARLYSA